VPEYVTATIRLDGLEATAHVVSNFANGFQGLADFFAALEADWRGWSGSRRWESLEGELSIEARHQHS
jgi:hypothetical protein